MATTLDKLTKLTWTLVLGLLPWGGLACGGKLSEFVSGTDTSTNFIYLKACDTTAECGERLACRCGICTITCKSDSECNLGDVPAMCDTTGSCEATPLCAPKVVASPSEHRADAGTSPAQPDPSLAISQEQGNEPSPAADDSPSAADMALASSQPGCGNQRFDPESEQCDRTANDDPTPPASCNADCTLSKCGDGKLGQEEVCDPQLTAACADDCTYLVGCGNGVLDEGEECDPGPEADKNEVCAPNCTERGCGNGYKDQIGEFNEVCDDGNVASNDGCSADCLSNETCGNGVVDFAIGEVCDDGNGTSGDGCYSTCRSRETCGDGYVNWQTNEACDDGNTTSGDGCSGDCLSNELCGNGIVDSVRGEECDPGGIDTVSCDADCTLTVCGDAYVNLTIEQCDDGSFDSAWCDVDCSLAVCGDGYVNPAAEECDGGNLDTATCNGTNAGARACTAAVCGDGYINLAAGEECDPLGASDPLCLGPAAGASACRVSACGDGYCNPAAEYGGVPDYDAGVGEHCPSDCQ